MNVIRMYNDQNNEFTYVAEVPVLIAETLGEIWGSWSISMIDNVEGIYLSNEAFQALRAISRHGYYAENNLAHLHPSGTVATCDGWREMTSGEKFSLLKLHLHRLLEIGLRHPTCTFKTTYVAPK